MDNAGEIREFLTTRRAKLTPERSGLPTYGRTRRVSGLPAREVALLAGISVELTRVSSAATPRRVRRRARRRDRALQLARPSAHNLLDLGPDRQRRGGRRARSRRPSASAEHPADRRFDDRDPGLRAQRPLRHPARQPLAAALYASTSATPCGRRTRRGSCSFTRAPGLSTPTGSGRQRHRRDAPGARRSQPLRPRPVGPRRAAVHAQRGVPWSAGRATTFASPDGDKRSTNRWSGT